MKIISWNVNGLRACSRENNFLNYVQKEDADIVCIQETKITSKKQVDIKLPYYDFWHYSKKRKGYSGTAILCKKEPLSVIYGFGDLRMSSNEKYYREDFFRTKFF